MSMGSKGRLGLPVLLSLGVLTFMATGCSDESTVATDPEAPALSRKVFLGDVNVREGTVTLPLFRGKHDGSDVYYIVTASSNRDDARDEREVNWAPKLANALGTRAVQRVRERRGVVRFNGTVDFSPERIVEPGPNGFPPNRAEPGSVADDDYTPLITTDGRIVLNAPHVMNDTGRHDSVIDIDTKRMEVVMELVEGRYRDKDLRYISTEASDPGVAALEASTYAPLMNEAPGLGDGDPERSARAAIIPFVNGETGRNNPDRQGLNSALLDGLSPLNITEIHPRNSGSIPSYSPLWDVHPARWTDRAIERGERERINDHRDVEDAVEDGLIESAGMGPRNPELGGLRAAGFIVNCPVVSFDD